MEKKFTYSKSILLTTSLMFLSVIIFSFVYLTRSYDYESIGAVAAILGAIMLPTAGVYGTSIIWYMKKSQAENTYKLDLNSYKEKSALELQHYEKFLELKQKYNLSDDDLEQLKYQTHMDEMTQEAFQKMQNNINNSILDATSPIENIQNY